MLLSRAVYLAVSGLLTFAVSAALAQESITLSVATSAQEGLFSKIDQEFAKETGVKINYFKSAGRQSYIYYQDVMSGKSEAAAASITWDDWMAELKKYNVPLPNAGEVTHRVVARDLQWVITNSASGVKKLSNTQVRDVFSGKVKNWKEVGGADLPVVVMLAMDKSAGFAVFRKMAMENREFATGAQEIKTREEMHDKVASTPGAVAYTAMEVSGKPGLAIVETEPIGRPITLITKGRPTANVDKLINFLRKRVQSQGQTK